MKLYFDNAAAVPVRPTTMSRLAALAQDYSANQEASGAAAEAVRATLSTAEHRLLNAVCGSKAQGRSVLWTNTGTDAVRAAGLEFRMFGVNSLDDLRQAKALGAVGFTCNYWRKAFDWAEEIGGVTLLK